MADVGSITITTVGGPVLLIGKVIFTGDQGQTGTLRIWRGAIGTGTKLDETNQRVTGTGTVLKIDDVVAATYTYRLEAVKSAGSVTASFRRLQGVELKR